MANSWFHFKQFTIRHNRCAHKVGTDGVLLGSWVQAPSPLHILDIGSGSGLIALMLAQRFPHARITGIELDHDSYLQSMENVEASPFLERVHILHADFLNYNFGGKTFDLIVSNPPFFERAFLSGNVTRDQARHTFSLPHSIMIEKATALLNKHGSLNLILPVEEAENIRAYTPLKLLRKTLVYNHQGGEVKRWLMEMSAKPGKTLEEDLFIRDENGGFSSEYRQLTRNFYLNF